MTGIRVIEGLASIAEGYDGLLCDAWGVVHDGTRLFAGVTEALVRFRETRGPVVILTNAPRLSDVIPAQLDRLGLPREAYDAVVTSGDATALVARERGAGGLFRLGPPKDDGLFEAVGAPLVTLDRADAILCTGLIDDMSETPDDYRGLLEGAAARGLPMICANPDKVVRFGGRLIFCAGALADLYQDLGGEVIMAGKPHRPIYELGLAAIREADGGATRVLAIGDSVRTDAGGANMMGLDLLFVAGGVSEETARGEDGRIDGERVASLLAADGAHAAFATESLRW